MKKQMKKIAALLLALIMCLSMVTGCTTTDSTSEESADAAAETSTAAESDTPEQSQTTDDSAEKVLLAVSFGTSYNDSREVTIGAIEEALQAAYPEYEVRRAFTSQIIIDILAERDGLEIDNVTEAMERLVADGVKEVVVQPAHVMSGYEYDDVVAEVAAYADQFDSFKIGSPLLTSTEDYDSVVSIITAETQEYVADDTAIVFMGHGTHHEANATYATLQQCLDDAGYENYFIGTVEATPSLDDIIALVDASGVTKVVLLPLMIVAGDHANNDMAGDEEDSWKSAFEAAGYEVECVLKGLGQYEGIQDMIVAHAGDAAEIAVSTAAESESAPTDENEASSDAGSALTPVYADQINDGTYAIEVSSSSSMFKIVDAQLTVADGEMTAVLTLSGDGYEKLYMGTGEQALADADDVCIYFVEDEAGMYTYEVPVAALDLEIDCAAWSFNKETWYDRVLVFQSALLPEDAYIA